MSNKVIISVSVASLLAFSSCQKDEFESMYEAHNPQPVQTVTDQDLDMSPQKSAYLTVNDEVERAANHDYIGQNEEVVIISIKEVSDGDDEADNGDDSKTSE